MHTFQPLCERYKRLVSCERIKIQCCISNPVCTNNTVPVASSGCIVLWLAFGGTAWILLVPKSKRSLRINTKLLQVLNFMMKVLLIDCVCWLSFWRLCGLFSAEIPWRIQVSPATTVPAEDIAQRLHHFSKQIQKNWVSSGFGYSPGHYHALLVMVLHQLKICKLTHLSFSCTHALSVYILYKLRSF